MHLYFNSLSLPHSLSLSLSLSLSPSPSLPVSLSLYPICFLLFYFILSFLRSVVGWPSWNCFPLHSCQQEFHPTWNRCVHFRIFRTSTNISFFPYQKRFFEVYFFNYFFDVVILPSISLLTYSLLFSTLFPFFTLFSFYSILF